MVYYGFPNCNLRSMKTDSVEAKTFGSVGLRAENYFAPFKSIPYKILGLGLDYSYSKISTSDAATRLQQEFLRNRFLLSADLITLVKHRTIGYVIIQGGVEFLNIRRQDPLSVSGLPLIKRSGKLNFRLGYGIQYYLNKNIAIVGEAGIGAGVLARSGLYFWF